MIDLLRKYVWGLLSGVLLALSFQPAGLYLLAYVALVPLLVSLWGKDPREAFNTGMTAGVAYFFGTLYWIYYSINHYGNIPFPVSIALVILLSLFLSAYVGLFAAIFSQKIQSTKLPAAILAPIFWISFEYLRGVLFTGFPWASIAYSQYRFLAVIQIGDLAGIHGVGFVIAAVNGAIADIFIMQRRRESMPLFPVRQVALSSCLAVLAFGMVLGYGFWRLHEQRLGAPLRVSVIQGNIDQNQKWAPAYQNAVLATYETLSREAASAYPSLIIWPETALPFYYDSRSPRGADLTAFQQKLDSYLLFGTVIEKKSPSASSPAVLTNSAVLLAKNGSVSYIYDKIHLVPFGEYVPLRSLLFFVDKLVAGIGDYEPGDSIVKAQTPFGSFATFICYEIIFPGLVRKFFVKDGDFMVTITNDAWFGRTAGPYQHFSMAVFRAIENRKPVIRAANTGISGFIDSSGRILKTSPLFERHVLTADIRTDSTRTVYSRYGDVFAFCCIVASVLVLLLL